MQHTVLPQWWDALSQSLDSAFPTQCDSFCTPTTHGHRENAKSKRCLLHTGEGNQAVPRGWSLCRRLGVQTLCRPFFRTPFEPRDRSPAWRLKGAGRPANLAQTSAGAGGRHTGAWKLQREGSKSIGQPIKEESRRELDQIQWHTCFRTCPFDQSSQLLHGCVWFLISARDDHFLRSGR